MLAHDVWCDRMVASGWSHAANYDAPAHTHDALVPFDQLAPFDRAWLVSVIDDERLLEALGRIVEHPRGSEAPLRLDELVRGLAVGWAQHVDAPDRSQQEPGEIVGWVADGSAQWPAEISVRWADGSVTAHRPQDRDLRRLGPVRPTP